MRRPYFFDKDGNHLISLIFTRWASPIESPTGAAKRHSTGRAGGFHLLRYSARSIADYSFALKCLADENLRHVQYPGTTWILHEN